MSGIFFLGPQPVIENLNHQIALSNATVTTNGNIVLTGFSSPDLKVIVNITGTPTGTSPQLTFNINEVDPIDQTTTFGSSGSLGPYSAPVITSLTLNPLSGGAVNVSWVISGAGATFTGVNVSVVDINTGRNVNVSGTVSATQSGTWTVQPGNTANTTPWLTTINQGGNSATVTGSNALKVDGSAVTQPVNGTVTANIGTTGGLALDATVAKLTITQSTALGSNTQILVGGSVTTASPTYSTGNINPFSLTTAGALRVDGSSTTQPVSGTVTSNIGTTGGLALDATLTGGTQTTRITDGTNTATVKAASTAPLATDPALVVSISPNSSITATNPSVSLTGTSPPASATYIGGSVTSGTPSYTNGQMNALSLTTGGLLRTDGSGSTQPISAVSLPLPTGAATETTLSTRLADATFTARINTLGQKTSANSTPVVIASDQSSIAVTASQSTAANLRAQIASESATGSATPATASLSGGAVTTAAPTYTTGNLGALSLTTTGSLRIDNSSWIGSTAPTVGSKTSANSIPVVIASDQGAVTVNASATVGLVDNAVFTDGTTRVQPIGFIFDETAGTALTENDAGAARIDTKRAQILVIEDATTRGTRTAVKAASTAAVATDPALVVAISPNNTVAVTGTVTANNASVSTTGSSPPASATYIGGSVTTAAPTYTTGQMSALSLTTGGLLRVDGSGVTQPISAASLPLPTGAATETTLSTRLADATFTGRINTLGQKTSANSTPVVLASDQSTLTVSGTVTANQGTAASLANAWSTKITDATNGPVAVKAASTAAVAADPALVVAISPNNNVSVLYRELATFTALATAIVPANNKSMWSILNAVGSSVRIKIQEIYLVNVKVSGVTGVAITFELRRIIGHSAGTAITAIEKMDSADTLDSNVTVRTNATVAGESATLLWRNIWSSDEWGPGAQDVESSDHDLQTMFPIFAKKTNDSKSVLLRAGEGMTVKCATSTTAGTFDLLVIFTQE